MKCLIFCFSIFLLLTLSLCSTHKEQKYCNSTHRGILKYHKKKDNNEYVTVSAILKNNALELFKGSKFFEKFSLYDIITPIVILSTDVECLTLNFAYIYIYIYIYICWLYLTKQILCLHKGELRNENDNKTLEEEQNNIINNNNLNEVSINITEDDLDNIPNGYN
ncbi:hypothetical protein PFFVO_05516 [Plasmodium falciparum Vietnam Oak-Knoll (FVO)]|uniref:Uncharacterized protein n=1 Tax=Plasmodium falciparum Vietnam Oak-Knoll (FVO) TaxID=1036723 RepID=A0A024UYA5_PLAFA|nr:hypothetical protein PFFVO_05516 [Plasmodium falciparum Vietnam Oak-Knoll (FVO)]